MATIKQLADMVGVSRGTVDRVLNHRGSVNPKTAEKIIEVAKILNYKPNRAGRSLAARKKNLKFGFLTYKNHNNEFFDELAKGVKSKAKELKEYGVSVNFHTIDIGLWEAEEQLKAIDLMVADGINGLVITPLSDPRVVTRLKELTESGIPVVTSNLDVPDSGRLCYVGCDYFRSGETAAGLTALCIGDKGNVGLFLISKGIYSHTQRINGFKHCLSSHHKNIKIAEICNSVGDDIDHFSAVSKMLEMHPGLDAIYVVAAGDYAVYRALTEANMQNKVKIITNDLVPTVKELIQKGAIAATIGQDPIKQGTLPLEILFDYLGMGSKPQKEYYYTDLNIYIRENF